MRPLQMCGTYGIINFINNGGINKRLFLIWDAQGGYNMKPLAWAAAGTLFTFFMTCLGSSMVCSGSGFYYGAGCNYSSSAP